MKKIVRRISIAVSAFVLALSTVMPVAALGSIAPDPNDYDVATPLPGQPDVGKGFFTLADINGATIDTTLVKVYFTDNTGNKTVKIVHADLCTEGVDQLYDNFYDPATPDVNGHMAQFEAREVILSGNTEIPVDTPAGLIATAYGDKTTAAPDPAACGEKILTIPGSRLFQSELNGFWVAFIKAQRLGTGGKNQFTIEAVGGIAGLTGKIDENTFGIQTIGHGHTYSDVSMPFGPDCSVRTPTFRSISIFDPDNGQNGVQPIPFSFQIIEEDPIAGTSRPLADAEFQNPNYRMEAVGTDPNDGLWAPVMDDPGDPENLLSSIEAYFIPGMSYIWKFYGINDKNNLELRLPFDQIYYSVSCQKDTTFFPSITVDGAPDGYVVPPDQFTFNFHVQNTGADAGSTMYSYDIRNSFGQLVGAPKPPTDTGTINPGEIKTVDSRTITASFTQGDSVCAILTIQPSDTVDPNSKEVVESCVYIGKKPYFQVLGGDVWTGGEIGTGVCTAPPGEGSIIGVGSTTGGSWGEYGVFALGDITEFGSAGQIRTGGTTATKLSFANTAASDPGNFYNGAAQTRCLTDLFGYFQTVNDIGPLPASANLATLADGRYTGTDVTINTSNITAGQKIVVDATGDITLTGTGIRYPATVNSTADLPQIVLLAGGDILVNNSVTQIDAWVTSKGTLQTCSEFMPPAALTRDDCTNRLLFNGPVITKDIVLRRTFGAETGSLTSAAETFNIRPDTYLGAYAGATGGNSVRVIDQQELPPRY